MLYLSQLLKLIINHTWVSSFISISPLLSASKYLNIWSTNNFFRDMSSSLGFSFSCVIYFCFCKSKSMLFILLYSVALQLSPVTKELSYFQSNIMENKSFILLMFRSWYLIDAILCTYFLFILCIVYNLCKEKIRLFSW